MRKKKSQALEDEKISNSRQGGSKDPVPGAGETYPAGDEICHIPREVREAFQGAAEALRKNVGKSKSLWDCSGSVRRLAAGMAVPGERGS
ncbi:hypothetical protein MKZ38_007884 [Zalerion maritima]|uniref:Uncharacterized protein n=1 Tax=Zalerion maritima TaxID=339359 RepID=A0AAD5WPH0_9PEZI|nr:hypothetical protein MKZ38_007884 [Zalerion maritima]